MATQTKFNEKADFIPAAKGEGKKPDFSVKAKGKEGYAGSGWLNEGKFGKYINVKIREGLPAGTTLYITPTKRATEAGLVL